MAITIRQAAPEDSRFLAQAILLASRSHLERGPFEIAFRLPVEEILDILEWMTVSDLICNCHFSKFVIAELAGEPVGALSGHDPGEIDLLPLGAALADAVGGLGYDEADLQSATERLEAMRCCLLSAQPGIWVVEWVAVTQAHRGRGIADHLLRNALALGANRSMTRSQVSTYLGNQAAINAYRKAGFGFHRETRDPAFAALLGVPGMVTMVRALP